MVEQARRYIELFLNEPDLPPLPFCSSFSTGKDSSVLLDLIERLLPDIVVTWIDDGWDYPESLQFLEDSEVRLGRHIIRVVAPINGPGSGKFWRDIGPNGYDPSRPHIGDVDFWKWSRGYNVFVGMRKQESGWRNLVLSAKGTHYYNSIWQHWQCCPLANWQTEDVWTYVTINELPYNPVYDKLAELGIPLEFRRVGPLTADAVWEYGKIVEIKRGWPELYNRYIQAIPEVDKYR